MQQMCCPIGIEIPNATHDGLQEMIKIPNQIDPSLVGGNEINAAEPLKAITLFSASNAIRTVILPAIVVLLLKWICDESLHLNKLQG